MSATASSGVVSYVGAKEIRGRKYWSFALEGGKDFFRTGTKNPNLSRGDEIEFEYTIAEYDGKSLEVDPATIKKTGIRGVASGGKSTVTASSRDSYWEKKAEEDAKRQLIISLQAATNTAISLVNMMLEHEMIKLPAKAKQADHVTQLVHDVAEDLFTRFLSAESIYERLTTESDVTADSSIDNEWDDISE